MPLPEDRWCQRCRTKNEILDDICKCGWHVGEDRMATDEELDAITVKLDEACANLQAALDAPLPLSAVKSIAHQDQLAAKLRDMSDDDREIIIQHLVEQQDMSEEDARDWVSRLVTPED